MEGIQVSTEVAGSKNQISVIRVGGYIDTTTSSEVERALMSLLKQGRYKVIIDLGNVDYISSAGWGIFISEIKSIRENGGDLKLVSMIPDVYEIFELLEFHHILDVHDTIEEAVQRFEEAEFAEVASGGAAATESVASGEAGRKPAGFKPESPAPTGFTPPGSSSQPQVSPQPETTPEVSAEPEAEPVSEKVDVAQLPVEEKIKILVARDPESGAFKINKKLNTAEFGYTRVGWFGVRSILTRLNLNSRKKRKQFAETFRKEEGSV